MALSTDKLALWGGVECTINRVGDAYFDQVSRSGHKERLSDLERVASLGIRKLRYPVLWEQVCPDGDESRSSWTWSDERLATLRQLGIDPIVGLLHHGSGPRNTNLLDPHFALGLQRFAQSCAQRYPWVQDYTPINEPLTTARFSALYGFWYPHQRDTAMFARALLNQCKATVLAMQAIRKVNPQARLVQTEDFGMVKSTKRLAYQAALDNQRRWLSLDLLCGRVDKDHPLYALLVRSTSEADVAFFAEAPCPPDVVGVNYYVTSDRFLDHRLNKYPPQLHGGNGRDAYVDIEAVRTDVGMRGHAATLETVWDRYKIPLAITEVHLDCHREEQLRWLVEAWEAAESLRAKGVDVEAVTMWSLFGAYDWNSLCTRHDGYYESGAFDLRFDPPRSTALAKAAMALSAQGKFDHPTLNERGWWWRPAVAPTTVRRASRNACPTPRPKGLSLKPNDKSHPGRPLLIVGQGAFGKAIQQACDGRSIGNVVIAGNLDDSPNALALALEKEKPWAVLYTDSKGLGCSDTAIAAHERGLPFVAFNHDADMAALHPQALMVRTCAVSAAACEERYLSDVARVSLDLLIDGEHGVWHLATPTGFGELDTIALLADVKEGRAPRRVAV